MSIRKFRWSRVYESTEEELRDFLDAKGVEAERWTADEFQDLDGQVYNHDVTIYCAEGSIVYEIGTKKFSLQPGDAISIAANEAFAARAGMTGCTCYRSSRYTKIQN
jgi:quercetin dioxygenase-like cupin family protein